MPNKSNRFKRYAKIVGSITLPFFIIWILVIGYYYSLARQPQGESPLTRSGTSLSPPSPADQSLLPQSPTIPNAYVLDNSLLPNTQPNPPIVAAEEEPPKEEEAVITGAIFGLDESLLRTDVMMVGLYNPTTNVADIFSIPRDSRIEISRNLYNKFNKVRYTPKVMKLNELHAYATVAKAENPSGYVISAMEEILGFDIMHNVTINTKAFNKIVDSIGGVKIYVPHNMYYYDPYQKLRINLKKGHHVLNGKQAEGFVRFRSGYNNGDLGRIEMQQYFLDSFTSSLLNWKNIFKIPAILNTLYENITTDLTVGQLTGYVTQYLDDASDVEIRTHTIPGEAMYINGVSYFVYDHDTVRDYVNDKINEPVYKNALSKDATIQIVNGSYTDGVASKFNTLLADKGYKVVSIGNFDGIRTSKTRICVSRKGLGEDLMKYFNWSQVVLSPDDLEPGIDIKIILGTSEN